ncbi:40S ribosomal protein S6-like [Drosophila sechellia]|uniref:40S ribosomal protein S6-like n=1 Tax=Drosophila sechellia TaxID=7238 RepID=UPI0013DE4BBD|nr:40S ribosomal protein S6-like [Drosophila sechellia]
MDPFLSMGNDLSNLGNFCHKPSNLGQSCDNISREQTIKMRLSVKRCVYIRGRVRLLKKRISCFRPPRIGVHKRKTVRRLIVDANMFVLSMVVLKKDSTPPLQGPMRSSSIRKIYTLSKKNVRLVVRAELQRKHKKKKKNSQTVQRKESKAKREKAKRCRSASNRESKSSVSSD